MLPAKSLGCSFAVVDVAVAVVAEVGTFEFGSVAGRSVDYAVVVV